MPASTLHKSAQQGAPDARIFHVQEHNSRHARPKDARVDLLWCASKRMPASSSSYAHGKIRAPPPRRAYRDARTTSYARLRHTRVGLLLRAPKMAAPAWTRAKMHASPLLPASQRCARLDGYGAATESSSLRSSSHVPPHDQEQ